MTRVENSPKKFQINNDQVEKYAAGAERTVDDISSFAIGQLVTICVKVAKVGVFKKKKKKRHLKKQDCILGDCMSRCQVVLWEGDTGKLDKGKATV